MIAILTKLYLRLPRFLRVPILRISLGKGFLGSIIDRLRFGNHGHIQLNLPSLESDKKLLIGPMNSASQGYEWSRAVERYNGTTSSVSLGIQHGNIFNPRVDIPIPISNYQVDSNWHDVLQEYLSSFSHILFESNQALFGRKFNNNVQAEVDFLAESYGIRSGLIFHGSDVRVPSIHRGINPEYSPYRNKKLHLRVLEETAQKNIDDALSSGLPIFVSTPELIEYVPGSKWLPLVIDPSEWKNGRKIFERNNPPVVMHAPTNSLLKGTDLIESALFRLQSEGLITYQRVSGVSRSDMPSLLAEADIFLEQFLIGIYSVAACEAMAAGCLVVGNIFEPVREYVEEATGQVLPILQAEPENLEKVILGVLDERSSYLELAAQGEKFVTAVHDGRFTSEQMEDFLL